MTNIHRICCISVTFATRIIAALGLSVSVLLINILLSFFFGNTHAKFVDIVSSWTMFGLHWTLFLIDDDINYQALVILICFLVYLIVYLFACGLLALGTVSKKPRYTLIWLNLHVFTIIDQFVALIFQLSPLHHRRLVIKSSIYGPLSMAYFVLSMYFWIVVYSARQEWIKRLPDNDRSVEIQIDDIRIDEPHEVKSPSFLSQNFRPFECQQILSPQHLPCVV